MAAKSTMKVENWPIDKLKPYGRNPRKNAAAIEAVAHSILEFGFRQPIVVDVDGVIVAGHTRWLAAKRLEHAVVPVHVVDLPPEKLKAYRIADNKTGELANWRPGIAGFGAFRPANHRPGP